MLKYITIFLFACIVSLSFFMQWQNTQYKKTINQKDEQINLLTKEKAELTNKVDQLNSVINRYKHNLKVCYNNAAKQEKLIQEYQNQIVELNNKYVQTKNELEKVIEHYELQLQNINAVADNMTLPDNVSEKVLLINEAIDLFLYNKR